MIQTNNYVKKLLKKKNKIIWIEDLKNMFRSVNDEIADKQIYKQIYYLKNKWFIISLKKDLFYIKNFDEEIDVDDIIEKNYWKILKKYMQEKYVKNYFIWWIKSLEIWNNNFSIPDNLIIINLYKRSSEVILKWKKIQNVNYKIKWFDNEKTFKYFKKQITTTYIDWKSFNISNYELSLLESLYSLSIEDERYVIELVKKNIRRNHKKINVDVFEYFLKHGKYGSSVKKIYELALWIRPDFAEKLQKILKKWYWM